MTTVSLSGMPPIYVNLANLANQMSNFREVSYGTFMLGQDRTNSTGYEISVKIK